MHPKQRPVKAAGSSRKRQREEDEVQQLLETRCMVSFGAQSFQSLRHLGQSTFEVEYLTLEVADSTFEVEVADSTFELEDLTFEVADSTIDESIPPGTSTRAASASTSTGTSTSTGGAGANPSTSTGAGANPSTSTGAASGSDDWVYRGHVAAGHTASNGTAGSTSAIAASPPAGAAEDAASSGRGCADDTTPRRREQSLGCQGGGECACGANREGACDSEAIASSFPRGIACSKGGGCCTSTSCTGILTGLVIELIIEVVVTPTTNACCTNACCTSAS